MKLHKSHRLFAKIAYTLGYITAEKLDKIIFECKKTSCSQVLQTILSPDLWNKIRLIYLEKILTQMLVQYDYISMSEYEKIMAIEIKNAHKNKKIWEPIILSQGIVTADMEHCFLKHFTKKGGDVPGLVDENLLAAKKKDILPEEYDSSFLSVGDYIIEKSLGEETYKAYHQKLGKQFVLKLFTFRKTNELGTTIRFFSKKMKLLRKLRHKNIVPVHDIGVVDEKHYIASPYVDGESLEKELENKSHFTHHQSLAIILRVAETISITHRHYLIHGNLTSKNIILDDSGNPYIKGFAIVDLQKHVASARYNSLDYISPQQVLKQKSDIQTDIYSLGIVLYQMLMGKKLFCSSNKLWQKYKIMMYKIPWYTESIPKEIKIICARATSKRKRYRYQNGAEMATDIRAYLNKQPLMRKYSSFLHACEVHLRHFFLYFLFAFILLSFFASFNIYKSNVSYNFILQKKQTLAKIVKKIKTSKTSHSKIKKLHKTINNYKFLMHTHKNSNILEDDYKKLLQIFKQEATKTNMRLLQYAKYLLLENKAKK